MSRSISWKTIAQAVNRLRRSAAALWTRLVAGERLPARLPSRSVAFTIAVTTLAAKMAKADGVALPVEERAFESLLEIPPGEVENVRRVYDLAKETAAGYEAYAGQIARLLKGDAEFQVGVLECLFHIAAADGILHPDEDLFLRRVAEILGVDRQVFLTIRASFIHDPHSPYEILGLAPDATDAEIKARHRALVREHHPDRLAASGVPPEYRAAADRRLAAINAAHEAIRRDRAAAAAECEERCS
jgi:DnaJ like chaperone protein